MAAPTAVRMVARVAPARDRRMAVRRRVALTAAPTAALMVALALAKDRLMAVRRQVGLTVVPMVARVTTALAVARDLRTAVPHLA